VPAEIPTESPLQSKRFIAFMTSEISWSLIIVVLLIVCRTQVALPLWVALLVLAIGKGAIEGLYLGGQASLDSYVRLAQIAAAAGVRLEHRSMTIHEAQEPKP
jgi:hypothetical protein